METAIRSVEKAAAPIVDQRWKVWLECGGEYDLPALDVLGTDFVVDEFRVVDFICPRCGKQHQSLLFPDTPTAEVLA